MTASSRHGQRRLLTGACSLAAACVAIRAASADGTTDPQTAQALFDEARRLMKAREYAQACPLFEQSQTIDPGGGTILNLGICHEYEGKFASAYRELRSAIEQADRDQRADRLNTARKHLSQVAAKVSYLTVLAATDRLQHAGEVDLDGVGLRHDQFGIPMPLDPGPHRLTLHWAQDQQKELLVVLGPTAEQRTIDLAAELPTFAMAPPNPPAVNPSQERMPVASGPAIALSTVPIERPAPANRGRWLGYAILGGGAVAAGFGSYFALNAWSLKRDSDEHFNGRYCTTSSCVSAWNAANRRAHVADAFLLVGAVALGVGGYIALRPESHHESPSVSWSLSASPKTAALTLVASY